MGIGGVLRAARSTECIDFSLSGLQILCAQHFAVGENVIIDLSLLDVRVQEMTGIVCTVRPEGGGFRYGIRFCFEAGKHMRTSSVSDCLRRIASYLKQNFVYS